MYEMNIQNAQFLIKKNSNKNISPLFRNLSYTNCLQLEKVYFKGKTIDHKALLLVLDEGTVQLKMLTCEHTGMELEH